MSIQRHYDGLELSSIYINGDELHGFLELITKADMGNRNKYLNGETEKAFLVMRDLIADHEFNTK